MKKNIHLIVLLITIYASGSVLQCPDKITVNRKKAKQAVGAVMKYDECLPAEIKLDTIVSIVRTETETGVKVERETVKQRLDKLKAGCKNGNLIDSSAKEIRFYQLQGCWGNPPQDYQEILAGQERELTELKKKYTVVELTCNQSGEMPF